MDRRLLTALFGPGSPLAAEADLPDAGLLAQLTAGGDGRAAAFAEAVRRHGPLVWAVCRRSLPGAADAEDAFQATFLALAQSPRSAARSGTLPGWLHGVAVRVAAGLRRTAARRHRREARAAVPEGHAPVADSAWDGAFAAVQDEVARLPASLKAAVVLCDLGRVPHAEAARQLGWKPGTLTGTLARARRRLAARLAERGLAPAVLAAAGAESAPAAVPWRLVEAVNLFPNAAAGTIPASLATLATEALTMSATPLKYLAAAAVLAGGLAVGVGPAVLPSADAQAPPASAGFGRVSPATPAAIPPAAATPAVPAPSRAEWEYKFEKSPADDATLFDLVQGLGRSGWEYVGPTVASGPRPVLVFKRPGRSVAADMPAAPAPVAQVAPGLTLAPATPASAAPTPGLTASDLSPRLTPPAAAPSRALNVADVLPADAGAAARLQAELDRSRREFRDLQARYEEAARMLVAAARSPAPAPDKETPPAVLALPAPSATAKPAPSPQTPEPPPAVFAVQLAPDDVAALVPVVDAGLGRESAKSGGPARVAAFGRQLVVFGGTPQTADRVAQLLKALGVRLLAADKPAPPPAAPAARP